MDKLTRIKHVLSLVGLPKAQQSDLCAYVVLALANIKQRTPFAKATNQWMRIHDIITFTNNNYNKSYAENSRETFRKQALHHFRTAAIVEDNGMATNSPNYRWRITDDFLPVLQEIGKCTAAQQAFAINQSYKTD